MSLIPKQDLRRLAEYHSEKGSCVSIYLPTHRAGNEIEQDHIRLKDLANQAESQLRSAGMSEGDITALLAPLRDQMIPQTTFWQHQLDGLCIFRSSELLYAFRLPFSFEPLAVVSPRFHIKPLLPVLSGDGQFYLLTLHKDKIELYHGTEYGMSHLEVEGLPENLADLLLERDLERPQQWHTDTRVPGGHPQVRTRAAVFHGHGVIEQHEEDDILRYYREVAQGLAEIWGDRKIPLILAGGDNLVALYKRANTYPYLLEDGSIRVNPASLTPGELHKRAWEIIKPYVQKEKEQAAADYEMWAGRDSSRASNDLTAVVSAAYFERVKVLFVAKDTRSWGSFDPESNEVHTDVEPSPENRDLLDLAAAHTLLNNGVVYAVPASEVPGGGAVAAIFRY